MDATKPVQSPAWRARRPIGAGAAGVALVMSVVLVMALNTTAKFLATEPLAKWLGVYVESVFYHAIVGFAILLAAVWARRHTTSAGVRRYAVAALAVVAATTVAILAIELGQDDNVFAEAETSYYALFAYVFADVFRYSIIGVAIASAWLYLCAAAEHSAAAEQVAIDAERMDRETAEARLQMLEAQIEPHFLFNTLAHVRRLYETDRRAGARMLRNLKDYLSIALPRMRDGAATLGRELDHVVAYLDIQQIRMGRRLAYTIDVPDELRTAKLPSLMLLTLVENAVKHGLTPLPEGGRIDVLATCEGGRLRVDVADTGRGFATTKGGGTGLANIRARLTSTYGAAASLSLALNQPAGVVATLELPLDRVTLEAGPP